MHSTLFEEVWARIVAHAGETFYTKTGLEFTYSVEGNGFYPSRTSYRGISKEDFRIANEKWPIEKLSEISDIVRGPSYVWAVLNDQRISKK